MTERRKKPGTKRPPAQSDPDAPAGIHVPRVAAPRIVVRRFGPEGCDETALSDPEELAGLRDPSCVMWVEVTGVADSAILGSICRAFALHELSVEDVLDPAQRPRVEHYDDYTFVVLKTLVMAERVEAHALSIFFGERFVVTLQGIDDASLDPVREHLAGTRGKLRERGADYLAYAIIDAIVDRYFPVVEAFDDHLERVEDNVLEAKSGDDPIDLARRARRELRTIRHAVWAARDLVTTLLSDDVKLVSSEARGHLRDCSDHLVQLQEMVESSREVAASLLEAYISSVSLKSNEVMKVLTVVATIFTPLTFITGLYGMNFSPDHSPLNMPELYWYWGYPFSLLLMLFSLAVSLLYFRKRGWFSTKPRPPAD